MNDCDLTKCVIYKRQEAELEDLRGNIICNKDMCFFLDKQKKEIAELKSRVSELEIQNGIIAADCADLHKAFEPLLPIYAQRPGNYRAKANQYSTIPYMITQLTAWFKELIKNQGVEV